MTVQRYIQLNGKKYAVMADLYEPVIGRHRTVEEGLTGKTIIQDFTVSNRTPYDLAYRLKVFINDPIPDNTWGMFSDLEAAYKKLIVPLIEHDDTSTLDVCFLGNLPRVPRVPANIEGVCSGVFYCDIHLKKVYQ